MIIAFIELYNFIYAFLKKHDGILGDRAINIIQHFYKPTACGVVKKIEHFKNV
jgi:hypothetical protein